MIICIEHEFSGDTANSGVGEIAHQLGESTDGNFGADINEKKDLSRRRGDSVIECGRLTTLLGKNDGTEPRIVSLVQDLSECRPSSRPRR